MARSGRSERQRVESLLLNSDARRSGGHRSVHRPVFVGRRPGVASLAAVSRRRGADDRVRLAALGSERGARRGSRRHHLHRQPRPSERPIRISHRGQREPLAKMGNILAGALERRLQRHASAERHARRLYGRRDGRRRPRDERFPAARVDEDSSACPTVAPDGTVLYGAFTRYNFDQGHLSEIQLHRAVSGLVIFGLDTTPASSPTTEPIRSSSRTTTTAAWAATSSSQRLPGGPHRDLSRRIPRRTS